MTVPTPSRATAPGPSRTTSTATTPTPTSGFYTRVGVRPNEGTIDVGLSVWLPGGGIDHLRPPPRADRDDRHRARGRPRPLRDARADEALAAHRRRQVAGRATLAMDVTFDALTPPIGGDGQNQDAADSSSAATRQSVGKGHLEQGGRWTGWIEAGGVRNELGPNARGNRDKSWGPRRWGGPKMWRWFSINIDDDTHFGGIVIGTEGGDLHRGWVWRDGEPRVDRRVEGHERARRRRRHAQGARTSSPPTRPAAPTSSTPSCSGSSRAPRASGRDTTIVNEGLARVDLRRPHRHRHQRVPPPARRGRQAGRADRLAVISCDRARQAPRSWRASPRGPVPEGRA